MIKVKINVTIEDMLKDNYLLRIQDGREFLRCSAHFAAPTRAAKRHFNSFLVMFGDIRLSERYGLNINEISLKTPKEVRDYFIYLESCYCNKRCVEYEPFDFVIEIPIFYYLKYKIIHILKLSRKWDSVNELQNKHNIPN